MQIEQQTELHVPIVTLSTENNNKLAKLLSEGFEWLVTWNEYKSKIETVTTVKILTLKEFH